MKEPSSSNNNRDERRRTHSSKSYGNHSLSREGSFSRQPTPEKSSHYKRSKSHKMLSSKSAESQEEGIDEQKEMPWMGLLKKDVCYNGVEHRLHYEILAYLQYMEQTPAEKKMRESVMTGIRRVVHGRFSGVEVSVYGSSATADLDIQMNPSKRPQDYIDKPMEAESLGFLLTDFMFYYGFTFSYKSTYISVAASPCSVLPKAEESELLSVRCLIDHEKEIAKSISKVEPFLQVFKDAYAALLQLNFADKEMLGQIIRFLDLRQHLAGPTPPANAPSFSRTQRNYYPPPTHPSLPVRPPPTDINIPRAPRTWKETPTGPSRMQHRLPTIPKLK
ncbi:hypothetical protein H0H87_004837 [Tephrocybe sp. NHM501043]|nr:hypothetical protein H0H87_004837 [Tephrocybe sp. NHM501043]